MLVGTKRLSICTSVKSIKLLAALESGQGVVNSGDFLFDGTSPRQGQLPCRRTHITPAFHMALPTLHYLTYLLQTPVILHRKPLYQCRLCLGVGVYQIHTRRHLSSPNLLFTETQTIKNTSALRSITRLPSILIIFKQPSTSSSLSRAYTPVAKMEPRARAGKNVGKMNFGYQECMLPRRLSASPLPAALFFD